MTRHTDHCSVVCHLVFSVCLCTYVPPVNTHAHTHTHLCLMHARACVYMHVCSSIIHTYNAFIYVYYTSMSYVRLNTYIYTYTQIFSEYVYSYISSVSHSQCVWSVTRSLDPK